MATRINQAVKLIPHLRRRHLIPSPYGDLQFFEFDVPAHRRMMPYSFRGKKGHVRLALPRQIIQITVQKDRHRRWRYASLVVMDAFDNDLFYTRLPNGTCLGSDVPGRACPVTLAKNILDAFYTKSLQANPDKPTPFLSIYMEPAKLKTWKRALLKRLRDPRLPVDSMDYQHRAHEGQPRLEIMQEFAT